MKLPDLFIEKYRELLGADEAADFFASFDAPAVTAFRRNPLKVEAVKFDGYEKIVGSRWGYYGKLSGWSADFLTGAAYSQEPAAQMVGEMAVPVPGMRVLDLCAAPGGKSTQLLAFLDNSGLLVANEISSKRSKILVENLERWGARNAVVLGEAPSNLTEKFSRFFDCIVVDAPCSGEGMFRKDPEAVKYWSPDYVEACAARQREILTAALKMLAPGGRLVYSTCTWSPEEDEAQVAWLTATYPTLMVVESRKYWPQRFRGEGQFVACLADGGGATDARDLMGRRGLINRQGSTDGLSATGEEGLTVERGSTGKQLGPTDAEGSTGELGATDGGSLAGTGGLMDKQGPTDRFGLTDRRGLTDRVGLTDQRGSTVGLAATNEGDKPVSPVATGRRGVAGGKTNLSADENRLWRAFAADNLLVTLDGLLQKFGEALYLLPDGLPDLSSLKIARNGLHLGTFKKNRFEPGYALGMALAPSEVARHVSLDDEQLAHYVHGETIALSGSEPDGWVQLLVYGNGLGFAKVVQNTVKNYYPKGLRRP